MSKVKDLPSITSLADEDLIYVVDDSEGTNGGRKITKANFEATLNPTPATHGAEHVEGGSDAVPNATPSVGGLQSGVDKTKLDGIETGAQVNQTDAEIKTQYENNADTNVFTDAEKTSLGLLKAIAQKVIVQLDPGTGQFSSITAAIASITDATNIKPYVVEIGPGVYTESLITMKPFVFINGEQGATIIRSDATNHDVLRAIGNTGISNCTIEGASSSGFSAIRYLGIGSGVFEVDNCIFGDNNSFIVLECSSGSARVDCKGMAVTPNVAFTRAFDCKGAGENILDVLRGIIILDSGSFNELASVEFAGNTLVLSNISCIVRGSASMDCGFNATNGGNVIIKSTSFNGVDKGLETIAGGLAPSLNVQGLTVLESVINDIELNHPGTTGFISANIDRTKIVVDPGVTIGSAFADTMGGGMTVVGDLVQGDRADRQLNISKVVRETTSVGVDEGTYGGLIDAGGLNLTVLAGSGFIEDSIDGFLKEVSWSDTALVLPSKANNYIFANSNGVIQQSTSIPNLLTNILLGRVATLSSVVAFIDRQEIAFHHHPNKLEDFIRDVLKGINSNGCVVTENLTTPFEIDITGGKNYFGTAVYLPTGGLTRSWRTHYRDGIGGFSIINGVSLIDNALYDDGSGTLASVSAGQFKKDWVFVNGEGADEKYHLIVGQGQFSSQLLAEESSFPVVPGTFTDGLIRIASIITQQGVGNVISIGDERPRVGGTIASGAAAGDHGSLTGLNDDDHTQYLLVNGTRAMSGNLNMNSSSITNVNTINGRNYTTDGTKLDTIETNATADSASVAIPPRIANGGSAGTDTNTYANANHTHGDSNQVILNTSTGIIKGGQLTPNGGDSSKFDIADGNGVIIDAYTDPDNPVKTPVAWTGLTALTVVGLGVNEFSFIALDSTGSTVQQITPFTPAQRRDLIILGTLLHVDMATVTSTSNSVAPITGTANRLHDLSDAVRIIKDSGAEFVTSSTNLEVKRTDAIHHGAGINYESDKSNPDFKDNAEQVIVPFFTNRRDGAGGIVIITGVTDVDVNFFDNDNASLDAMPTDEYQIKRIYFAPGSGISVMEYGQTTFKSIAEAEGAIFNDGHIKNPELSKAIPLHAWLIVKEGTTNLANTADAKFIQADRFGIHPLINSTTSTTTSQQAYENSSTPQIVIDAIRGGYTIKEGAGVGGTLFQILDESGAVMFSVDSDGDIVVNGLVDGRDIAADGLVIDANADHVSADGKSHSDVVLNNTHRGSDGKNHSDVVLNNTHRGSDGKNHSDVVLNNTHRTSDGSNHSLVTTHAARHLPSGADALAVGTPSDIGSANAEGSANALARQDHIHNHGNQAGGTTHSTVTQSVNGFMSSTDKTKLDQTVLAWLQYTTVISQPVTGDGVSIDLNFADNAASFPNSQFSKTAADEFTVLVDAIVRVYMKVDIGSSSNNQGAQIYCSVNGTQVPSSISNANIRSNADESHSATTEVLIQVNANDIIRGVLENREGGGNSVTAEDGNEGGTIMRVEMVRLL